MRRRRFAGGRQPILMWQTFDNLDAWLPAPQPLTAYVSAECGYSGYGCLAAQDCDEMHLLTDLHAVIQPNLGGQRGDLPAGALFVSSLRRTAPVMLLNVSLGSSRMRVRVEGRASGSWLLQGPAHWTPPRSREPSCDGGVVAVDRRPPILTGSGKVQHLHADGPPAAAAAGTLPG